MPNILPIVLYPHPALVTPAAPVNVVDARVQGLLNDMLATLYNADGIGLAANQVNVLERLVVIDVGVEEPGGKRNFKERAPLKLVNPEIVAHGDERTTYDEGCLSLPEVFAEVARWAAVTVRYLNETGAPQILQANGLLSICLQHEIDHLNGVLFPDHLSKLKRHMLQKKFTKRKAEFLAAPKYPNA